MSEMLVEALKSIPPWLAVFILGATPIGEVRVALPVAREVYHLSWPVSLFWSILGNVTPIFFLLLFLDLVHKFFVRHLPISSRFFDWLFERTRAKFIKKYKKSGAVALIVFIGTPLPFTGAWTGALAAYLFGIPFKKAFLYCTLGILLAATIVSGLLLIYQNA